VAHKDNYDVIVVGAGPGGEVVAGRCGEEGLATVVVESHLVGGECAFWGCMPSKGLLRPGGALAAARRVPGSREAAGGVIDVSAALGWRDEITNNWDDKYQAQWLEQRGVDLVRGMGRLAGPQAVEVETDTSKRRLTARKAVVVATGSSAAVPPIAGLRDIRIWDNHDVTEAKQVPRRLIVLGGGAVGVEMAQAWRSFGAEEVTIIEAMDRLLPMEEPFAGDELKATFEAHGITVITGGRMVAAAREADDAPVQASLEDGREIIGDEILVSVGRRPRTQDLGLETVGLEPGRFIDVDDNLLATKVEGEWLYAIGDVCGRALFTHMAKYHARCVADHILGVSSAGASQHEVIPRIVFTDPQVAAVGLTHQQAQERGMQAILARSDVSDVAGAKVTGQGVKGPIGVVIDAEREVLVGATFVGPDVGDMLHAATIAIVGEVPLRRLRHAVPSFPSLSEIWLTTIESYDAQREEKS
jgi:pyruvate/2-oxoglutarate dehydrogenase complex dihydrolipoamide dehydrogenase (E3) component